MKFCKNCQFYEHKDNQDQCYRFSVFNLITGEIKQKEYMPCMQARAKHQSCGPQGLLFEHNKQPKHEPASITVVPNKKTTKKTTRAKALK